MNRTVVAFGGNLPFQGQPPSHTFAAALAYLTTERGHRLRGAARLWQSRPVRADGPDFFNTAAWIDTPLSPEEWLQCLLETEHRFGRQRPNPEAMAMREAPGAVGQPSLQTRHSAARTLDLDLLWFEGQTLQTALLTLPHPRASSRAFVLGPLLDLERQIGDLRLPCPETGRLLSVSSLWAQLPVATRVDVEPTSPSGHWPAAISPVTVGSPAQELGLA
jgi:2-amino-4-hydroxy-6-hydroxymethyldihydropteridine diphosphokinase